jgi:MFS family permease
MHDIESVAHSGWPGTFRALHHRNYRLFWLGTLFALAGSWLQITALNWLILQMTDSPLMLGLVNLVAVLPVGLLSPFAGVIGDHYSPRRLLLLMRLIRALTALILAILVLTASIQIWHIMLLMLVGAATDTIELPARFVFLTEFVEDEHLSNAIALTAGAITLGSIIGPALAGVLVSWASEGIAFLVACAFNLVFVASLLAMRLRPWTKPEKTLHVARSLLAGLRYVWLNQNIKSLLILLAGFSLPAMQHIVLMPVFARDILNSDAQGYGLLMSASGVASLVGTLIAASLGTGHRGRWLIGAGIAFSLSLILFSLSRWLPLSWAILLLVGSSQVLVHVLGGSLSQIATTREFRGRVASFFALFNSGLMRLGGLQAGALAQYVSAPFALQVAAGLCLVWVLFAAWRLPSVRRLA